MRIVASSKRRWVRAVSVAGVSSAVIAGTVTAAQASWFQATVGNSGVTVRDCYHPVHPADPSTACRPVTVLPKGTVVHIVCQVDGQWIGSDPFWDYVVYSGGEGFASDEYINTGYPGWITGIDTCVY